MLPHRGASARAAFAAVLAVVAIPSSALAADLTLDDRALKTTGSWSKVTLKSASGQTLLKSKRKGVSAASKTAATSGGTVVVQTGKGRGTVAITVGGKRKLTVRTSSTKKAVKSIAFKGSGIVKVTVSKQGAGVYLDAIVLSGLGPAGGTGGSSAPGSGTPGPGTPGASTPAAFPAVNAGSLTQVNTNAAGEGSTGSDDVTTSALSPNGQKLAFWARSTNLVPGVDGFWHLYLKDLTSGAIEVLDRAADGTLANDGDTTGAARGLAWSPDGTEILFTSNATNLGPNVSGFSPPYLYAKEVGGAKGVVVITARATTSVAWSPDGAKIAFGTETDLCVPPTSCTASVANRDQLYAWEIATDTITPISATSSRVMGGDDSLDPVWSPDSKKVAFESWSNDLVAGDTNASREIFMKDLTSDQVTRISVTSTGAQANSFSERAAWSPDGSSIAFESKADNFVVGDINSGSDIFIKHLATGAVSAASATPAGEFKLFNHRMPKWSPDGSRIAFVSESVALIPTYTDANQRDDIYIRDLRTGTFQLISARADGVIGNADSTLWPMTGSTGGWLPDGHGLVFVSRSTNFATDGNAFAQDLFLKRGL